MIKISSKKEILTLLMEEQMLMPRTYYDMLNQYKGVKFECGCGKSHGILNHVNFDLEVVAEFEYSVIALRCPEWSLFQFSVSDGGVSVKKPHKFVTLTQFKGIFNLKINSLWYAEESLYMSAQDEFLKIMQNS